jgi:PAS domain S-box-containing protein/diguanylate cyclase (GGDEF)-like protein
MLTLKTLLYPALYVMNKLSFKIKIIASISILFLLLLIPSRTAFTNYNEKSDIYKSQLIGLEYIEIMKSFIRTIQSHRTLSNDYLKGDKSLQDDLIENEKIYINQQRTLREYDEKHLKILSSNPNYAQAISLFNVISLDTFDKSIPPKKIFKEHINVINKLIATIHDISKESSFSASKDPRINYLAYIIQESFPRLYEYSNQLKDSSNELLNQNKITKEGKEKLFSLATDLTSIQLNLRDNTILSQLDNYHGLEKQTTEITYNLSNILETITKNIINNEDFSFNNQLFVQKISTNMDLQENLYGFFTLTYTETIRSLQKELKDELLSLISIFLIILLIAFYIFIAFYQSITGNLKKLQKASEMISSGQTQIKLEVDKKDEIGHALLAFNTMSEKLHKNISFLDGYKTAIDNSSIVSKTNLKGIITYANEMFCDVSGYTQKELMGRSHNIVRHPDVPKKVFEEMWDTIKRKEIWKGVVKNKNKNGETYIVNATILPILDHNGNIIEYFAVRHDITELERSKEEIRKQRTDLLTGLPNRNQLLVDLKTAIKPIILYLNIDDFSGFNDFYGSHIGDSVLLNLSNILRNFKEKKHFKLYKFQADQFILLFQEGYLAQSNFQIFFEEFIAEIELEISNINIENQNRINISVTGGAATYYAHDNYQKLILYSNIARRQAKLEHKKFLLFNHSMRKSEDYAENIEWIKKIKEALGENRVVTYYQPILDNQTGEIVKYETLVRMIDKDGHPVPTLTFLEISQKAKLYPLITKIVIDKAFQTFENLPSFEFSINLTIEDILSKETTDYIYMKLENYSNSHNVIFEITESEEVSDYKIINNFIQNIKKFGVKIAIDDFGSGYANFEHILNIDADFIKIDGSLIKNINKDKNARIITEAIISFSKKLGRKTITEYVHNEEVYEIVKDLGADYSQGFYFGIPSPDLEKP